MLTQKSQRGGAVHTTRFTLAVSGGRQYYGRQALRERRHVDYRSGHGVECTLPQQQSRQKRASKARAVSTATFRIYLNGGVEEGSHD